MSMKCGFFLDQLITEIYPHQLECQSTVSRELPTQTRVLRASSSVQNVCVSTPLKVHRYKLKTTDNLTIT